MLHSTSMNNAQVLEGVIVGVRVVDGQQALSVVTDPLIDQPFINNDLKVSDNTGRAIVKRMGLKPVVPQPRVVRFFLSEYEAAKKRLLRETERHEPAHLAKSRAQKPAAASGVGPHGPQPARRQNGTAG